MKPKLKKALSFLFIVASVTAVFFIAFRNQEFSDALNAFTQMNIWWVFGIFMCWVFYTFFDAMNQWCYLRRIGYKFSIGRSINVSLIGFYYSNITPSAAGGQPMQVNSMRKAGIPVGYGTMAVTIRFITNQFVISGITLIMFLFNRNFVYEQLQEAIWFARIGWVINFGAVPLVIFAAFKRNWIQGFFNGLIRLLAKTPIIKDPDAMIEKTSNVLDTYHQALLDLIHRPGLILIQLACSFFSILGLLASIVFVYYAFGLEGTPWYHILTLSGLLYVSASVTPLPGASGAQEGGFLLYYNGIFPEDKIGLALLVWRFFTYYLYLIVGVGTVILEKIIIRQEEKNNTAETPENQQPE